MGFPARYKGSCLKCGLQVEVGHYITWSRTKGQKGVYHVDCSNVLGIGIQTTEKAAEEDYKDKPVEMERQYTVTLNQDHVPTMEIEPQPIEMKTKGGNMQDSFLGMISQAVMADILGKLPKQESGGLTAEQAKALVREVMLNDFPTIVRFVPENGPPVDLKGKHKQFARLLYYTQRRKHSYLFGPHGTGKSTGAKQVAEALGLRYGFISLTPQTPESRILGYCTATGAYMRTPFRECYEHGGVFCVDELDNMSQALATTWNGALENGHMAFPDGLVERHKDFVMVGTGNTSGSGANPAYPERRPFDKAFRDRFVYIKWDHDAKLEKAIALSLWPDAEPWVDWVKDVRKWSEKNYTKLVPSPRVTYRLAEFLGDGQDKHEVLEEILWQGDTEAKSKVLANCPLPV
jgi:cobaltochelatase CobS